jgi:hypothetical protein
MPKSSSFADGWHSRAAQAPISSGAFMYKALGSTHLLPAFSIVRAGFFSAIRLNQNALMIVYLDQHVATGVHAPSSLALRLTATALSFPPR